jgi:hypothetical protein
VQRALQKTKTEGQSWATSYRFLTDSLSSQLFFLVNVVINILNFECN